MHESSTVSHKKNDALFLNKTNVKISCNIFLVIVSCFDRDVIIQDCDMLLEKVV